MKPIIVAEGLVKKFPKKTTPAIDNVNLTINPAEVIAVVGHNGAGKSTLFDLVSGFTHPTAGTLSTNINRSEIGWCPPTRNHRLVSYRASKHCTRCRAST
ncbi:ATP-binding cassette domain-containing protein [Rothia sp. P6271]|uniref:ATP-binding cassette domain-containing protein n=1 Tax=Rothia sp. P6271 TaxID=3402659 RepID=UPI003AD11640